MSTTKNAIHLGGEFRREEAIANVAITPGMLCEFMSTGKVKPHATAGGRGLKLFAVEDALQGHAIEDDYAAAALVSMNDYVSGAKVQGLLAAGVAYVIGDEVVSAGDGTLQKASSLASAGLNLQTIGYCSEAVDLSASGAVDTLGGIFLA